MRKLPWAERDKLLRMEGFRAEQDRAKAEADASYKIREIQVQSELEQQKAILAEQAAITVEKELVATVEKPANAQKRKTEIEAEADKIKAIRQAEAQAEALRIDALAQAEARKIKAQAEAEAIRLTGEAEAEAIRAKGIADADAKSKLADAMAKYGDAAVVELVMASLPAMMQNIAKPMENIDKITVIDTGDGKGGGAAKIAKTVTNVAGAGLETLKELTGIDLANIIKGLEKQPLLGEASSQAESSSQAPGSEK